MASFRLSSRAEWLIARKIIDYILPRTNCPSSLSKIDKFKTVNTITMVQLKPLQTEHMADVLRIQDYCYTEIEPESLESLQAKILASPNTCLIAESSEGAVGYLIAVPIIYPHLPTLNAPTFELPADADTLYIHDLAVDSTGRGKGVAQALVRASINAAKSSGLSRACLVAIQNSQRFWEQFGFEVVAEPADEFTAKLASYGAGAQLMRAWI